MEQNTQIERLIVDLCKDKFRDDLAAVVVFGSYNTGQFVPGKSDIDTLVYLVQSSNRDIVKEKTELSASGKNLNISVQQLAVLDDVEKRIYEEGSWSTWITLIAGSKHIYTTPEFGKMIQRMREKEPDKEKVAKYVREKDTFELDGYFKDLTGWNLTKSLYSHIRRKLQIIYHYTTGELSFDYNNCLDGTWLPQDERVTLAYVSGAYNGRKEIEDKTDKVKAISRKLTATIDMLTL